MSWVHRSSCNWRSIPHATRQARSLTAPAAAKGTPFHHSCRHISIHFCWTTFVHKASEHQPFHTQDGDPLLLIRRPLPRYPHDHITTSNPPFTHTYSPVSVLLVNAIAILSEDRFLARIGWGNSQQSEASFGGGSQDNTSVKAKMINLINSVRTLMRSTLQREAEGRWCY